MKSINLFGQEEHVFTNRRKSQKSIFDDYEGFVEKFNPKKTTDDCYTPPAVYDYVLQYVADHCDIDGMTVVRPFYPGGDYESLVYPDNCVVIDNPPFSIVSQIVRFYLKRGIKFFLFAPHLTLFSADLDCTRIVCGAAIVYENGAKVNTSFLSNMFGEAGVIGDPVLYGGDRRHLLGTESGVAEIQIPGLRADGFGCSVHREKQGRDKDRQAGNGASLCA